MDVKRKSLFLRNMPKNIIRGLEGQKSNFKAKLEIIGFASRLFENLEVDQPILPEISHILLTWSSRPYLQGDLAPCCEPAASRLRAELSAVSGFLGEDAGLFKTSLKFLTTTAFVNKINSICTT